MKNIARNVEMAVIENCDSLKERALAISFGKDIQYNVNQMLGTIKILLDNLEKIKQWEHSETH